MTRSISAVRAALRRAGPLLISADLLALAEALRARGVLPAKVVEAVMAERAVAERWRHLEAALSAHPAAFDDVMSALRGQRQADLAKRLSDLYEEVLSAPPDVCAQSYRDKLWLSGVPGLPPCFISRRAQTVRVRDALLSSEPGRITLLHGMPGAGKTTLMTEAVRNCEVVDHFHDGIFWITAGPNVDATAKVKWMRSQAKDSERALLIIDDVWADNFVPAVVAAFGSARLAVTSRDPDVLGSAQSASALTEKLPSAWSLEDCRWLFAKWLQLSPEDLPHVTVDAICFACARWPLAVSMVAQVVSYEVSQGGSMYECLDAYLLKIQRKEFHEVRSYPEYGFEEKFAKFMDQSNTEFDLSLPVRVTLDNMSSLQRERLLSLAILDPEVSISKETLKITWAHLLEDGAGADVFSLLPGSLVVSSQKDATFGDAQWQFRLHAVVRDAVLALSDASAVVSSHAQLLRNYERLCGERQWGRLPEDGYIVTELCRHLELAGRGPEIPEAFADFLFTSRLFAACGWAGTLQALRRTDTFFASPEQRMFLDNLTDALEEAAAAGTTKEYAVPLLQTLLLLPRSHPMFLWADRARRELLGSGKLDQHLWRSAVRKKSPFRTSPSRQLPHKMRGSVAIDKSHGQILCVAVSSSKRHIVAVGFHNSLIVCNADSLTCTSSGMQLRLQGFVKQAALTNDDRTLLLLTEDWQLFCAHLRCGVEQLPRDCCLDGEPQAIPATALFPSRQLQRFAITGRRLAVVDMKSAVAVFDLTFDPRNNAASMTEVCSIAGRGVDRFKVQKDILIQMRDVASRLLAEKKSGEFDIVNCHFQNACSLCSSLIDMISKFDSKKGKQVSDSLPTVSSVMFHKSQLNLPVLNAYNMTERHRNDTPEFFKMMPLLVELKDLLVAFNDPPLEISQCGSFLAMAGCKNRRLVKLFDVEFCGIDRKVRVLRLLANVSSLRFLLCPNSSSVLLAVAYQRLIGIWSVQEGTISMLANHLFDVLAFDIDLNLELCAVLEWPALTTWRLSLTSKSKHLLSELDEHHLFQSLWIAQRPSLINYKFELCRLQTNTQPPVNRMLKFDEFRSPSLVTLADRMLLVTNVADEALVILDPRSRSVLLFDPTNKMKKRIVAASAAGIAVGGHDAALCEYRYKSDGQFAKAKPLPLGSRWAGVAVTAVEFTARGNLVIGLENGAILWADKGEQNFRCILEPSGKCVFFLTALPKHRGFFSWSADASSLEVRVWDETKKKVKIRKSNEVRFDNSSALEAFMLRDGLMRELIRPKLSRDETFVAMVNPNMMSIASRIIICNVDGSYRKIDMFVTKPSPVSNILFHPANDRVLFFSSICFVFCFQIEDPSFDRKSWPQPICRLTLGIEPISSLSVFDAKHLIVGSWESVTSWRLSPSGELSDGRLILPRSKLPGNLELVFVSDLCMLCVTTDMEERMLGVHPLERLSDL